MFTELDEDFQMQLGTSQKCQTLGFVVCSFSSLLHLSLLIAVFYGHTLYIHYQMLYDLQTKMSRVEISGVPQDPVLGLTLFYNSDTDLADR